MRRVSGSIEVYLEGQQILLRVELTDGTWIEMPLTDLAARDIGKALLMATDRVILPAANGSSRILA